MTDPVTRARALLALAKDGGPDYDDAIGYAPELLAELCDRVEALERARDAYATLIYERCAEECELVDAEAEPGQKGGIAIECARSIRHIATAMSTDTELARLRAIEAAARAWAAARDEHYSAAWEPEDALRAALAKDDK